MLIELSEEQVSELCELLGWRTRELLGQIDRAFDREFKVRLKQEFDRLEAVRLRLIHRLDREEAYG